MIIVSAFVSMFFQIYCVIVQPNKITCAGGWINGIRPNGTFQCIRDVRGFELAISGTLYCGTKTPILGDDGRNVFVYCKDIK